MDAFIKKYIYIFYRSLIIIIPLKKLNNRLAIMICSFHNNLISIICAIIIL